MDQVARRVLRFDRFALDLTRGCLRLGDQMIDLRPKTFEVLRYLAENAGRLVSKQELFDAVWPNVSVGDDSLVQCIRELRHKLDDDDRCLIKTVSRRGYLLDVTVLAEVPQSTAEPRVSGALQKFASAPEHDPPALLATMTSTPGTPRRNASPTPDVLAEIGSKPIVERPDAPQPPECAPAFAGERRQVTVLSCEAVIPEELSSNVDLEDLRDAIDAYHRCVAETAARFMGLVAKRIGNGALVNFGYPVAHEDDAEQAVRAGLELCGDVHAQPIWQSRVGIATGEVVITGSDTPGDIVGEALNLSRRLQVLAEPGMVAVDSTTKLLIGDLFEFRELSAIETPGSQAVRAWQVHASRILESRFAALRSGALTPFVGREEEMALLGRRWTQAAAGESRAVLITGEAGIGKSRLVAELEGGIQTNCYVRFHYSCSPRRADSPLYPFIDELERSAGFDRRDAPREKLAKLSTLLERTTAPPEDVALLADLLSLPTTGGQQPLNLSPQRKKEKTTEALVRHVAGAARARPVLVVFEDAHWIDPSSLDALSLMIERFRMLPVLLLVTFRPDFQPPWLGQPNVTMLSLNRLGRREGEALVRHVAVHKFLPDEIVTAIAERTDGVPLFTEEVTKAVLDSNVVGTSTQGLSLVPATLRASLMARLDGLGAGKQIIEIGAVIGREFSYELLAIVSRRNERELQSALVSIVESGLVFRRGLPPAATFVFKHALIQDIAYSALLRDARRQLHARSADALREHFADIATDHPEVLAHHYDRAGNVEHAVKYWMAAGDLASRRAASREAVVHYRAALASFKRRQISTRIDALEPEICMKLGNALIQSEGYRSVSAVEAYRRAQTRAVALGQTESYAKATGGLAPLLFSGCHYHEVVNTIKKLIEEQRDGLRPDTRIHLYTMLGVANYCLGNFVTAWDQLETARVLDLEWSCTPEDPVGGGDPAVVIRNYMGRTGSVLGRIEKSLVLTEEGLTLARKRADAFSLAWALYGRACALRVAGRYDEGMSDANEAANLCESNGFQARLGTVLLARGALLTGRGDGERALQDMDSGGDMWHQTSGNFHMSEWLSYRVDFLWRLHRLAEADAALRKAEQIVEGSDEKSHLGELLRLRGNLLHCNGAVERAETHLGEAIEWSREREAKLFELRATRDLARIYILDGKVDAARALLNGGIALFAEDLLFPDLEESRKLLLHL